MKVTIDDLRLYYALRKRGVASNHMKEQMEAEIQKRQQIQESLADIASHLKSADYIPEYRIYCGGYPRHYKVDFANPKTKHIVEFDGPCHTGNPDRIRDLRLKSFGWEVTRLRHASCIL